ncbi:hypothetical protein EYM_06990 [Ignicoccus islandicus DSM 13165]|uniref:Uncharacterized protein n=1 Tax=Ignicoccus islandicus DSM 13165 TaxID=940295 RepID=A0A0U3FLM3_9CREN|nr:shikimate kinase [Ignicoccus islandicus]ALU12742.1 hypothetical protein EYM_06990 [Ignicoccus islandicus DSM 13165]
MRILIGGLNGTGKSSVCKALESKYGIKCAHVPPLCYVKDVFTPLSFEIYSLQRISSYVYLGEAIDESPLTIALYLKALPFYASEISTHEHLYDEMVSGIIQFSKELRREGAKFVWLTAPIHVILSRLRKSEECPPRGLWNSDPIELGALSSIERNFLEVIDDLIDLVIDTGKRTPEEVADEVMKVVDKD